MGNKFLMNAVKPLFEPLPLRTSSCQPEGYRMVYPILPHRSTMPLTDRPHYSAVSMGSPNMRCRYILVILRSTSNYIYIRDDDWNVTPPYSIRPCPTNAGHHGLIMLDWKLGPGLTTRHRPRCRGWPRFSLEPWWDCTYSSRKSSC